MTEKEISLAEMFRVTNHLPAWWDLKLTMTGADAWFTLEDPDEEPLTVYPDGDDTGDHLLAYVNAARIREGMKPVDWQGREIDGSDH